MYYCRQAGENIVGVPDKGRIVSKQVSVALLVLMIKVVHTSKQVKILLAFACARHESLDPESPCDGI